jgi:hypothetical protein
MTSAAKGASGERSLKQLALSLGWPDVVDLARTYPGADLWCRDRAPGRPDAHLWLEAKRYSWRKVDPERREHARLCALAHAPDPHLVVCFQSDLSGGPRQWRVKMVNGQVLEGPAPLFISFEAAKPPYARGPPYTTGREAVRGTGVEPARGGDGP